MYWHGVFFVIGGDNGESDESHTNGRDCVHDDMCLFIVCSVYCRGEYLAKKINKKVQTSTLGSESNALCMKSHESRILKNRAISRPIRLVMS